MTSATVATGAAPRPGLGAVGAGDPRVELLQRLGDAGALVDGQCRLFPVDDTLRLLLERNDAGRQRGVRPTRRYSRPLKVQVDFTSLCNLACRFCYNDSRPADVPELGVGVLRDLLRQLDELRVLQVVLSGGEVLSRRRVFLQLLQMLADRPIGIRIVTNGWFLDEAIANRLAEARVSDVQVSIDGAEPAVHDQLRGRAGSWRRAVRGAALLLQHGVHTTIASVLTRMNAAGVESMAELAHLIGVPCLTFADMINVGRATALGDSLSMDDETYEETYERIARLRDRYRQRLDVRLSTDMGVSARFSIALNDWVCYVRSDGLVFPSCMIPVPFGDIHEEPLHRIWERMSELPSHPDVMSYVERFELHRTPRLGLARSVCRHSQVQRDG